MTEINEKVQKYRKPQSEKPNPLYTSTNNSVEFRKNSAD